MSDSEDSTVTYTEVSSPFEDLSDIGSPGVVGLRMMLEDPYVEAALQDPPSPDYVPSPEHPPLPVYVPYVSELVYPEFMPPEDEEDPEEDPVDYPADGGDDDDDDDDDDDGLSDDDEDEDNDVEEDKDEEEEEEHPALADSVLPPVYCVTARMSIRAQTPISLPPRSEVEILLALPTSLPSPLTPLSSPLPQIPFLPLPVSPPLPISPPPLPTSPTHPLGYRAVMIRLRAEAPSTSYLLPLPPPSGTPLLGTPPLLPIQVPTSSPPLLLSSTDRRADSPEVCLPPQKRMCIALGPRYEIKESSFVPTAKPTRGFRADYGFVVTLDREIRQDLERDVGYGITDTWDEMVEAMQEVRTTDMAEISQRMTNFVMTVRQDTDKIYVRLDKAREARSVLSGRLNLLGRDRRSHAYTALLIEREATLSPDEDCSFASSQPRTTGATCGNTKTDEYIADIGILFPCDLKKMALKRTTRLTPATTTNPATTTSVTNAQIKAMIDQGVTDALAACDADRNTNGALTWWNSHFRTAGHDVAYEMTWAELKKKMTDKYRPRGEMKKLEVELWNLKVKGIDVIGYNQRFQELAILCVRMFPKELDKIERYVDGLPDIIHGKNKRKQYDNQQQQQHQQNKRQDTNRSYTTGSSEKKPYRGSKPMCPKCNYHHDGPCAPKCHKCNRVGHLARFYRSPGNANTGNNQRGIGAGQKPTCYECGAQGHFKRECPKLKNKNRGNQGGNGNAPAKVYVVGRVGTNPDSNVVIATFLLNNHYASVLFDTGADRSFVSIAFSS
ncbi:reverse transcriptase domain-containing protein [Tanacetum coccineum]